MKQLLVNADDFGLSCGITQGIIEAHTGGIVTSTSLVASGRYFKESVEALRAHPGLATGVHLTLVEENSVCNASQLPTLAPRGKFPPSYGALLSGILLRRIKEAEIEREMRAQVEKCLDAGLKPTHLDSHQHVHALPSLFKLVARIAIHYGIPAIRIPRDCPRWSEIGQPGYLPKVGLCTLSALDAWKLPNRLLSSDHFAGLFESGNLTEGKLLGIINLLSPGVTELVCHPARPDAGSLQSYGHWRYNWAAELAAVTSTRVREAIQMAGIQLVNYSSVAASG